MLQFILELPNDSCFSQPGFSGMWPAPPSSLACENKQRFLFPRWDADILLPGRLDELADRGRRIIKRWRIKGPGEAASKGERARAKREGGRGVKRRKLSVVMCDTTFCRSLMPLEEQGSFIPSEGWRQTGLVSLDGSSAFSPGSYPPQLPSIHLQQESHRGVKRVAIFHPDSRQRRSKALKAKIKATVTSRVAITNLYPYSNANVEKTQFHNLQY